MEPIESKVERARVRARIRDAIKRFLRANVGKQIHSEELHAAVAKELGKVAPGSCDRIMRLLRQDKEIEYSVISRRESLYSIKSVDAQVPQSEPV